MRLWKVLGVAGIAGVAATGVVIARSERRRAQLTPDQIRDRLRQRHAAITPVSSGAASAVAATAGTTIAEMAPAAAQLSRRPISWLRGRLRPVRRGGD